MENISTLKGVVDFAREKEAEAEGFYRNLAGQVKSERSAALFNDLAADENRHYQALQDLDLGRVERAEIEKVTDLKISDYMRDVSYSPEMSYQDILILAMKSEEHSHSLYQGLAMNTDDPQLKKLFEFLAAQEAKHKLRLETEYDDFVLTED